MPKNNENIYYINHSQHLVHEVNYRIPNEAAVPTKNMNGITNGEVHDQGARSNNYLVTNQETSAKM